MEEHGHGHDKDAVSQSVVARDNKYEPDDEDLPVVESTMTMTRQEQTTGYLAFIKVFFTSNGAPQLLLLSVLLAFAVGSTIGIVPDVLTDRFAKSRHGYDGTVSCSSFDRIDKPDACQHGSDDAQAGMAYSTFLQNILTLLCNTTVGSMSDARGRRPAMLISTLLQTLAPAVLVLMQLGGGDNHSSVFFLSARDHPLWYFLALGLVGLINWISIGFSMLSDVIPRQYRAAAFGLFGSSFYLGFAIGPLSALVIKNHLAVSILSLTIMVKGLVLAWFIIPETLPPQVAERNLAERLSQQDRAFWFRPVREMAILNQSFFFVMLSIAYFFSGMVYSSDRTLVTVYIEDQLNVRDGDLAKMYFLMGMVGIAIQGLFLESLLQCLGEKGLLVTSFLSGTLHNLLYGLAKSKTTIYIALCLSQLTKTNFPLVSSIASNNVSETQQGRMQGALFALSALANAIGPMTLELIYNKTKDNKRRGFFCFGPGTMFVFASMLYLVGTIIIVTAIPAKNLKSDHRPRQPSVVDHDNDLQEPLLLTTGST